MEKRLLILTREQLKNILRFGTITSPFKSNGFEYISEKFEVTIGIYDKKRSAAYKQTCLNDLVVQNWLSQWSVDEHKADKLGWNVIYYVCNWEKNMPCTYKSLISEFEKYIGDVDKIRKSKYKTHEIMESHIEDMINQDKKLVRMLKMSEILY
jgi:hypothetical protein